jgi:hypothetical protein
MIPTWQDEPMEPVCELINQLLDTTIVYEPNERIQSAGELLSEVDLLLSIMRVRREEGASRKR